MNYERSNVTGRLTSAGGIQTPSHIGGSVESPAITYPSGTTFPKDVAPKKGIYGDIPKALVDKIRTFQAPNGIPIHLKGGTPDKVLFGSTLALCGLGLAIMGQYIYESSFPKKAD